MIVAFDLETHLVRPGMLAPKCVCLSHCYENGNSGIATASDGLGLFRTWLKSDCLIVGHNVAYDVCVLLAEDPSLLPPVFEAYEAGRIRCTMVRQKLLDISLGCLKFRPGPDGKPRKTLHSLAALSELWLGEHLQKADTYRLRYHELDGVPLDQWPEEAITYAVKDAETTLAVWNKQQEYVNAAHGGALPNEPEQCRAAFVLQLMSIWGMRTDPIAVGELKVNLQNASESARAKLRGANVFHTTGTKKAPKETKNLTEIRARVEAAYAAKGQALPRTESGAVSTDEESLSESGDEALRTLGELAKTEKLLGTYVPVLELGTKLPICPRYNPLVESGRTSCGGAHE